jgi:type II secretory pathway component GspD/PulD (secretin)
MSSSIAPLLGCLVLMLTALAAPPLARAQDSCYTRLPSERISLDLREAPVQTLLRLLSKQYRVNMVVTDDVTGTVTVSFFDLPVRDVFRGILEPNNLQCVEFAEGIYRVSSAARVRSEQQAAKAAVPPPPPPRVDTLALVPMDLRGIMSVGGGYRAIVNNRVVLTGDVISDHRVERITASEVVLRRPDGAERLLTLAPAPVGK